VKLVLTWNKLSIIRCAKSISEGGMQITSAFEQSGTSVFETIEKLADQAEKRAGIMVSIARHKGLQMPLADPLVVAVLVDDNGEMERFQRPCNAGHDAKGKPTFDPMPTSSLCALWTQDASEREELYAITIKILGRAMSP